ncbi:hypothetical protein BH688_07530 [Kushneria phosphatilytica]|nr:hypothetical protein BH688_07530 [Kushneria phosphatilytica]
MEPFELKHPLKRMITAPPNYATHSVKIFYMIALQYGFMMGYPISYIFYMLPIVIKRFSNLVSRLI